MCTMERLSNEVENADETVKFLKEVNAEFPAYASEMNNLLRACQQQSQQTLKQHLRAERDNLTSFLCQAGSFFNVCQRQVRRYLRSCQGAALLKRNQERVSGIFSPEVQADILEALMLHKHLKDDDSLAQLRKCLPEAILDPAHKRAKPNAATRKRKLSMKVCTMRNSF